MKRLVAVLRLGILIAAVLWFGTSDALPNGSEQVDPTRCTLCDSLGGTSLDWCKWADKSWFGATVVENGRLLLTTSSDNAFSEAKVLSQYRFLGDLSIEVTWEITTGWGTRIAPSSQNPHSDGAVFGLYIDDQTSVQIIRGKDAASETLWVYSSVPGQGAVASIPCTAPSGRFRISRSGAAVTFAYDIGHGWQQLCRTTFTAAPAYVFIRSVSVFASHRFVTAFSGFLVTTGTTDYTTLAWNPVYRPRQDLEVGTVTNTYLLLREWNRFWKTADPLAIMFDNGIRWLRTPVLMTHSTYLKNTPWELWPTLPWRDEYWSCFEYTERLLTEAAGHGFRLSLILNLSDKAAHAGVQDAPAGWRGLSVEETGARLEEYAYETAKYFADRGLAIEDYEIGSEIEWGILNFRPGERIAVPSGIDFTHSLDYMRQSVWSTQAQLLKRAIAGVKRATPVAAITLHVNSLDVNPDIAISFFQTMVALGVEFDHAGISLPYPDTSWSLEHYSSQCWFRRLLSVVNAIAALGKPVVICEGVYASDARGIGGAPMPDYPYSPEGQTAWVRDMLAFVSNTPAITGFYYWCADWFPGVSATESELKVQSYGLFADDREIKPAMAEFRVTLPPG